MFMCKRCHDRSEKHKFDEHFARSFGPCELCRKSKECVDCKAYKTRTA